MGLKEYLQRGDVKVWDDVYDTSLDDKAAPNLCDVYFRREVSLYTDPKEFFKHTYLTKSMRELIEEIADSLEGKKGSNIFLLTSLFGGGKTHTLITLYHAFESPESLRDLDEKLAARISRLGRVKVVVMDASSTKLVPHPAEPYEAEGFKIRTIWGMLAYKLGRYADIEHLDSKGSPAPDIEKLRSILSGAKDPTIILLDEIVPYVFNMTRSEDLKDYGEKVILFLENLARAIEPLERIALVISIQAEYRKEEPTPEELYRDVAEKILRHIRRETTKIIVPVAPEDIVMVLKRRIFSYISEDAAWEAQDSLQSTYRGYEIFGTESDWQLSLEEKRITAKDTYPFHPKYLEVLREFVTRNRDLQKTRDAIRITRKVVRRILSGREDSEFIMPWHIDLRDKDIRNLVLTESYKNFRDVASRDIVSEDGSLGSIANCSKPALALKIATVVLLKTYTYEAFKEPLKVFPDLKDIALMTYDPESFSSSDLQPPDIEATVEEMLVKLPHFTGEENRFWFTPYPSVLEYVERRADEMLRGATLDLHRKLVNYVKSHVKGETFGTRKKGEKPSGEVFDSKNVITLGYGDDIGRELRDEKSLRLVVMVKPDVSEEELRNIILREPGGGKRTYVNTIAVVFPSKSDLADELRYVAKIEAAKEIKENLSEYYTDKDIIKIQSNKLESYINENEGYLMQQILSLLTKVAYPYRGKEGDDIKIVEASPSSSLISQVEAALKDPRTGPKLRTKLEFKDISDFLKDNLRWDLVNGDRQFEFKEIMDVFYTSTAAPFTTQKAVEEALLEGLDKLDIGVKIEGELYWKRIGSSGAERPKGLRDTAVILPWKRAAEQMKEELLSKSGVRKNGVTKRIWYEVEIGGERIPLEDLVKQEGWEEVLRAGVIEKREEELKRGFVLDVKPKHVELNQGEKAVFEISIEPVEDYSEEIELQVEEGELSQGKGRPPMKVSWEVTPRRVGRFPLKIRAVSSDGLLKEESVSIVILSPEEERDVDKIDSSISGEKLLSISSSDLISLKIAIENVSKLGMKAKVNIDAEFGGNIRFSMEGVSIDIARFLVQKLDEISRQASQLGLRTHLNGSIELENHVVLDDQKIAVLSQLNGRVIFKLLVRRKGHKG
jgi:predicted AAA+ superfamily ATPase